MRIRGRKAVLCALAVGLLTVSSAFVSLADVKTLDELTTETTAVATVPSTEAATVAETEAQTKKAVDSSINSSAGTGYSFTDSLLDLTDMSEASPQVSTVNRQIKIICVAVFQVLASFASGFFVVCVGMDMAFLMVTPLQGFLVPGINQTLMQMAQQGGQQGAGNQMASQSPMMGNANYGVAGGRFGGGGYGNYGNQGMMQGQQQGELQSRQIAGIGLVSPCAIATLVQCTQNGKIPVAEYGGKAGKTTLVAAIILVLASTGVLAKVGIFIGVKVTELINSGLAKAM